MVRDHHWRGHLSTMTPRTYPLVTGMEIGDTWPASVQHLCDSEQHWSNRGVIIVKYNVFIINYYCVIYLLIEFLRNLFIKTSTLGRIFLCLRFTDLVLINMRG